MTKTLTALAAALMIAGPVFAEPANHVYNGTLSGNAETAAHAIAMFAASENGDGAYRRMNEAEMDVIISTSNADMAAIAAAKLSNGERGFN